CGWRANFVSAKAQKPQEYFVYFKVFVTQAGAKFAAKRARGFIQRFLRLRGAVSGTGRDTSVPPWPLHAVCRRRKHGFVAIIINLALIVNRQRDLCMCQAGIGKNFPSCFSLHTKRGGFYKKSPSNIIPSMG
ncbi:MAG: hypothetical protein IJU29_06335, partial [Oscillospiraceae bacterium]|nr:hypothetical protein [Oscillospiraceae bacterium]